MGGFVYTSGLGGMWTLFSRVSGGSREVVTGHVAWTDWHSP